MVHQKGPKGHVPVLKLPARRCVTFSKSLRVWVFSSVNGGWSTDFTPSSGVWGHRRCVSASGGGKHAKVHSGLSSSSDLPESSRSPATNPPNTHVSPATFRSSLEAEVQGGRLSYLDSLTLSHSKAGSRPYRNTCQALQVTPVFSSVQILTQRTSCLVGLRRLSHYRHSVHHCPVELSPLKCSV